MVPLEEGVVVVAQTVEGWVAYPATMVVVHAVAGRTVTVTRTVAHSALTRCSWAHAQPVLAPVTPPHSRAWGCFRVYTCIVQGA